MTRKEVYAIIEEEYRFAKQYDCVVSQPPHKLADMDKPLELWLLWMEQYLCEARKAMTSGYNKQLALDRLRCILSLGINAAVYHGLPRRNNAEEKIEDYVGIDFCSQ